MLEFNSKEQDGLKRHETKAVFKISVKLGIKEMLRKIEFKGIIHLANKRIAENLKKKWFHRKVLSFLKENLVNMFF